MPQVEYDDTQLQRLFTEMTVSQRTKALKSAFRREAEYVRKVARNNLRASGLHITRGADKAITKAIWKKRAGFRVSILRSMYTTGKGSNIPLFVFAEGGTRERYTRKRHLYRGRMRKYGFMEKTLNQTRDKVTDELHTEVINSITTAAQRYGCR